MKYYVIAGEASGDLHGSNLLAALKAEDSEAEFRCWGGDLMEAQGATLVKHYRELAFMGFTEVIANLRTILKNISLCKKDITQWQPDAVILIDYPGFNLRIAEYVRSLNGPKVLYYISPQVWAWKEGRVKKIKKFVHEMYCILPFEKEFYASHSMHVQFVGHPLVDAIENYRKKAPSEEDFRSDNNLDNRPIIAVLPGSRRQEINIKLPIMLSVINEFPEYQFVVGGAPSVPDSLYDGLMGDSAVLARNRTYDLLQFSHAAVVTSGTATLETSLFGVPLVVCYKGGQISYQIAKQLVKVDYISLVNLVMGKEVAKELIQTDLTKENLVAELKQIVGEGSRRTQMLSELEELKATLGGAGASAVTAKSMLKTLTQSET